ncbi:hypothetical protein D3C83_185050 [compost metagenome]
MAREPDDLVPGAHENAGAELGLEFLYLAAECRLRAAQRIGRGRDIVAVTGDVADGFQLLQVHEVTPGRYDK